MANVVLAFVEHVRDATGAISSARSHLLVVDDATDPGSAVPFVWRAMEPVLPEGRLVVTEGAHLDVATARKALAGRLGAGARGLRALAIAYSEVVAFLGRALRLAKKRRSEEVYVSEARAVPVVHALGDEGYSPVEGDVRAIDFIVDNADAVIGAFSDVEDEYDEGEEGGSEGPDAKKAKTAV